MGVDIFSHDLAAEHSALLLLSVVLILGIAAFLSLRHRTDRPSSQLVSDTKEERAPGGQFPRLGGWHRSVTCTLSYRMDAEAVPVS